MKILLSLIFFILFSHGHESRPFEFAIVAPNTFQNDKQLTVMLKILNSQVKANGNININFSLYRDIDKILEKYKTNKIKAISIPPMEYFKDKSTYDNLTQKRWLHKINGAVFHQFYFIANRKDRDILENLDQYTLSYEDGSQSAEIWIKTFLYKKYKKRYQDIVKKSVTTNKPHSLIYKVFFNKKNVAVISKATYDLLLELNPSLEKKIVILKKSEPNFFDAITLIGKNLNKYESQTIDKFSSNVDFYLEKSSARSGGSILGLYKVNEQEIKNSQDKFLKYLELKKKYETKTSAF